MTHLPARVFILRHRSTLIGLSVIFVLTLGALFAAYWIDVFPNESVAVHERTIEVDELLAISALSSFALFVFAVRQYFKSKGEVRARIVAEQRARELAYLDGLTGLPNRRQFDEAINAAIAAPPRAGGAHATLLLDLNGFKKINDVHGHAVGDHVLNIVGQRLRIAVRDGDLLARFGGDEFAILATQLPGPEAATTLALRVIEALKLPVEVGGHSHAVGAAIGIALIPNDAASAEEALRKADVALYRAKAERRSALRFFEPTMDARVHERAGLEDAVRAALSAGRIHATFLPNVSLRTHKIIGFEVAPQWVDPGIGVVPTERFLEIADEAGLIHELMSQLLREACEAAKQWPRDIKISLDIHPSQLRALELPRQILGILDEAGIATSRLELEITESAIVADLEGAQRILGALREAGVRIVLDNFGTGYSSLYHLRNIRLDKIKIDRSFISNIVQEPASAGIVNALVGLAQGLGFTVAADGVEVGAQEATLLTSGCEEGQGVFFGRAVSAADTQLLFSREATTSLYVRELRQAER